MAVFALTAGTAVAYKETLQQVGGLERIEVNDAPVPPEKEHVAEISPGRTYRDALAIRSSVPLVSAVSPEIEVGGIKVSRVGHWTNPRVVGVQHDNLITDRHQVEYGRFLCDTDQRLASRVCVVGRSVIDSLWDDPNAVPLGEPIRLNNQTFRIVGILTRYETASQKRADDLGITKQKLERKKARGQRRPNPNDPFGSKNNLVLIPLPTAQVVFKSASVDANSGLDAGPDLKLTRLIVQASDVSKFDSALQQVRNVLILTHHGIPDFGFNTREDWADDIDRSISATKITFGLIAAITLLTGGLGITNIMLASITERVRELGIRRAIGARSRDVFGQILIESLVLAMLGGLFGLVAGLGLLRIFAFLSPSQNAPILEPAAVAISFGSAVFVGLLAGIYPAWKASLLSPIQALRYE
jgi:putative ABC transport system permease protein